MRLRSVGLQSLPVLIALRQNVLLRTVLQLWRLVATPSVALSVVLPRLPNREFLVESPLTVRIHWWKSPSSTDNTVKDPYRKRDAVRRDTTSILNKDHQGTLDPDEALANESYVFNSTTCAVLNPEGEVGPFYVNGEYVREDLTDGEIGVDIVLEAQLINVNTCEPLVGAWFDIWNCNSTGVYSGVQSSGNGNSNDASNLDNTALRGIQQSDDEGVVKFTC